MTSAPLLVTVAFHADVTVWPFANRQPTVQPEMAEPPAVTRTEPWKPPGHCPTTEYEAEHVRVPLDGGPLDDGRLSAVASGSGADASGTLAA